jgi:hypothetical protein
VSQTFTAPVPALGPQARVTGRLVVTKLDDYQPSAADVARAKASGVYAYDVDLAMTPRDQVRRTGNLAMTASAVIDLATLHEGPETPLTQSLGALNFYTGPARAVFFWSYQVATNGDAFWSAGSEFFVDGKYAAVAKLQQMALACADSARSNYYHGRVELLLQKAASMDVFTASYTMAGLLLGPSSFGLATIAIWGIGWGMGKYMVYQFNSDVDGLTAEMMSDPECEYSEDAQNPENPENPESPDNPGLRRRDWQRRTAAALGAGPARHRPGRRGPGRPAHTRSVGGERTAHRQRSPAGLRLAPAASPRTGSYGPVPGHGHRERGARLRTAGTGRRGRRLALRTTGAARGQAGRPSGCGGDPRFSVGPVARPTVSPSCAKWRGSSLSTRACALASTACSSRRSSGW